MEEPESALRTLVLVRHAKSSWDLDVDDHERPLSGRGRRDAVAIGRELAKRGIRPDLVLCSTAVRTRQTWEEADRGGAQAAEVRYVPEIYHAWVPELVSIIRGLPEPASTVLMLGHAPGIPDLVQFLAARDSGSPHWARLEEKFPTAAMAILGITGSWADVGRSRAKLAEFEVARG
jgi:phosphohistidine phosphatase